MSTTQEKSTPSPILMAQMIWGALGISTAMYIVILWMQHAHATEGPVPSPLLLPLSVAAAACFGASFVVPRFLLRRLTRDLRSTPSVEELKEIFFQPMVVHLVLADAVCILGFLLAQQMGFEIYFPFWIAGLVSMGFAFPSEARWRRQLEIVQSEN